MRARFPQAVGSLFTGSAARGDGTASSDLDIIVLMAGPPAPMRRTDRIDHQLVEFFVHTEDSFHEFADRERVERRSPLVHMAAHSQIVTDVDGTAARVQSVGRELWDAGPQAMTDSEIEDRRYGLTSLLDDLADETEPAASAALAATVLLDVADLALVSRGRWTGRGRWLMRRLHEVDSDLSDDLVAGLQAATVGDTTPLVRCGLSELQRVGGLLDAGYERDG